MDKITKNQLELVKRALRDFQEQITIQELGLKAMKFQLKVLIASMQELEAYISLPSKDENVEFF